MGKLVVFLTGMDKVPESCWECDNHQCLLPTMSRYPDQLKKAYKDKRHPSCPLRLVDPDNLQSVDKSPKSRV